MMETQSSVPEGFDPNARVGVVENPQQGELNAAAIDLSERSENADADEVMGVSPNADVPESDQAEGEGGSALDELLSKLESLYDSTREPREEDSWDWADKLYTNEQKRIDYIKNTDAEFIGEEKDFSMRPNMENPKGKEAFQKMQEFGASEIRCVKGVVDFSSVSVAQTTIDGMTLDLGHNKALGFKAFAEQFNKECPLPNGEQWDAGKVKEFARENGLEFHECSDMKTVQLVPAEIHRFFKHFGGRAECRIRDGEKPRSNDGFDD